MATLTLNLAPTVAELGWAVVRSVSAEVRTPRARRVPAAGLRTFPVPFRPPLAHTLDAAPRRLHPQALHPGAAGHPVKIAAPRQLAGGKWALQVRLRPCAYAASKERAAGS